MSSLRLALKQSLEESGQLAAQKRDKERRRREDESSRRRKRKQRQGPKKRGPGRPRKDGSWPHPRQDTERSRLEGGSSSGSSSEEEDRYSDDRGGGGHSSSSENEFSGSSDNDTHQTSVETGEAASALFNDSDEDSSDDDVHSAKKRKMKKTQRAIKRHQDSAANRIQNQWKKKQGKDPSGTAEEPQPTKRRKKKSRDRHGGKAEQASTESKPASSPGKAQTVPPPAPAIVHWIRQMSVEEQREHITAGHRVKVRFETRKKRDGKLIRRRKWYGGLVTGVSTGGSKIRIKYDDGTSEVSKYPDEDIVVDNEGNGRHRISAKMFLPPELLEREETNAPAARYQSPSTIDDNSEQRERVRVKKKKKHRKMTVSPRNAKPKLSFSKGKAKDDAQGSHDKDGKTSAPVASVEIPSSTRTPSPEVVGVPFSHSHDSTESSGFSTLRSRDTSPEKSTEPMETTVEDSDGNFVKTDGPAERDDHDYIKKKDGQSDVPAEIDEPPPESVVEKKAASKPTLTIRLIPPKASRDKSCEPDKKQSRAEDLFEDFQSSDEESSTESLGRAISAGAVGTPRPGNDEVSNTRYDVIKNNGSQDVTANATLSELDKPRESCLIGKKRQAVNVDDSEVPPAKRHTAPRRDKEEDRSDNALQSSDSVPPTGSKDSSAGVGKSVPASGLEKENIDAQKEEAATSTILNEPVPRVKEANRGMRTSPIGTKPRSLSSSSRESTESIPSQKSVGRKKKRGRQPPANSSIPQETQGHEDSRSNSSKDSGSPTPLSADPKQSTDEAELSKPVSTLATGVELDPGSRSDRKIGGPILTGSKNSAFDRKGSTASSVNSEKSQRSPGVMSGSDDESLQRASTPLPHGGKGSSIPVARSGRRAAQQANQRISAKQEIVIQDPFLKPKRKREKAELRKRLVEGAGKRKNRTDDADDDDDPHWVQCDNCLKWRVLPSSVDTSKLPKHWYCEMNVYDAARNSCDAPEQKAEDLKKKRKRGKRARVARAETPTGPQDMEEDKGEKTSAIEGPTAEADSTKRSDRPTSRTPPIERKEGSGRNARSGESTPKPKRSSPSSTVSSAAPESPQSEEEHVFEDEEPAPKRALLAGGSSAKKAKSNEADEGSTVVSNEEADTPAPKKRGRKKKEKGGKKGDKEAENQEWVQCEKCEKWRRLPKDIAAEDLPEVWYCDMNTWDPTAASCDAEEDKADPNTREYNIFGSGQSSYGTSGKLSYRNLIFGASGRKQNRPISERTRAAESLFTSLSDEHSDGQGYPKVMYANSSAFVPRKSHHHVEETASISFFDLMSHSNLWAELRVGSSCISKNRPEKTPRTFDEFPKETQRGLKELVYRALGTGALAGHEVLLEAQCRNWENTPQQWEGLRALFTIDLVAAILSELVKSGLVEVAPENPTSGGLIENGPRYRRVVQQSEVVPAPTAPVHNARRSRCMKISKPWKRAGSDQWCM